MKPLILLAAGLTLVGTAAAPGTASAVCFVNETDREIHYVIPHENRWRNGSRARWFAKLKPSRKVCCKHAACRGAQVLITTGYWFRFNPDGGRPKARKIKIPKIGKVIAPVNPVMPHNRFANPCNRIKVPRNSLIRVFGRLVNGVHRFGCEVWSGSRLLYTKYERHQKPALRGHLRVCNQTRELLFAVLAFYDRSQRAWRARGWRRIQPGRCHVMVPPRFYRGPLYVHGRTAATNWAQKDARFCVNQKGGFNLVRADRRTCPAGYAKTGFLKRRPAANRVQNLYFRPKQ